MNFETKTHEEKMKRAISAYEQNLETIRVGKANPAVLSKITFEYYGAPTLLNTMADIRVADAKTLMITPYDKTTNKAMEKALLASDIGITPTNDGNIIRLSFPQPSEERRKELCKQVQKHGEEAKVAIRNIRRDANELCKKIKKDGSLTEDEEKNGEKAIQDLTDKYIKNVDAITAKKEKDILEI